MRLSSWYVYHAMTTRRKKQKKIFDGPYGSRQCMINSREVKWTYEGEVAAAQVVIGVNGAQWWWWWLKSGSLLLPDLSCLSDDYEDKGRWMRVSSTLQQVVLRFWRWNNKVASGGSGVIRGDFGGCFASGSSFFWANCRQRECLGWCRCLMEL